MPTSKASTGKQVGIESKRLPTKQPSESLEPIEKRHNIGGKVFNKAVMTVAIKFNIHLDPVDHRVFGIRSGVEKEVMSCIGVDQVGASMMSEIVRESLGEFPKQSWSSGSFLSLGWRISPVGINTSVEQQTCHVVLAQPQS